uniref:Secreted protein n=1 Tax=Arundo donax TaxID=35708 RepID=A0A0A9E2Y9_ARUDO
MLWVRSMLLFKIFCIGLGRLAINRDELTSNITPEIMKNHPSKRKRRAVGASGRCSSSATMPATTPDTIDATDVHVDTTIALPCLRPRVCMTKSIIRGKYK